MEQTIQKARILVEALPYLSRFRGKTMVVKVGGESLNDEHRRRRLAQDVVLLQWVGVSVVLVHGGGTQISAALTSAGVEPKFVDGVRVTDERVLKVVEMVLGGTINQELVRQVSSVGGQAVGLTGQDGNMALAERITEPDLGFVGRIQSMHVDFLRQIAKTHIPVVAPLGMSDSGKTLNVNADVFACELAVALGAEKLVLLTDVSGVKNADGDLISTLTAVEAEALISSGVASGGMVPKLRQASSASSRGVNKVHIIDGRVEHSLLLEIFTSEGIGTEVIHD